MRHDIKAHYEPGDKVELRRFPGGNDPFTVLGFGDHAVFVNDAEVGVFTEKLAEVVEQMKTIAHEVLRASLGCVTWDRRDGGFCNKEVEPGDFVIGTRGQVHMCLKTWDDRSKGDTTGRWLSVWTLSDQLGDVGAAERGAEELNRPVPVASTWV